MSKGYTLLEVLIAIVIMGMVFTIGAVTYRDFTRRQQVTAASRQIQTDIRLAQTRALSGEKPVGCLGTLSGYRFTPNSPIVTQYSIEAICSGTPLPIIVQTIPIPAGITVAPFSSFMFKPLGQGTNLATGTTRQIRISATGTTYTKTIIVSASGDINE
jgi:prepilin-type N-terminal cleavage/methylation domain-containing protein